MENILSMVKSLKGLIYDIAVWYKFTTSGWVVEDETKHCKQVVFM